MRSYDLEDSKHLNAEQWQLDLLKLNPEYVFWGPYEDYMCGKDSGWNSPQFFDSWKDFDWKLDELNEVVNFYFEVDRKSKGCESCDQSGYSPYAKKLKDSWYAFDNADYVWVDNDRRYNKNAWQHNLTQEDVDALWDNHRLRHDFDKKPTADQVNAWSRGRGFGHDSINSWICIGERCKRENQETQCNTCKGNGYNYVEAFAHVNLVLWMTHPRKGASRGIEIKNIEQKDLPEVFAYLAKAADRVKDKFSKVKRLHNKNKKEQTNAVV